MEMFCALLTGVFLWVFSYHWHYGAMARARELAGPLLIEVKAAGNVRRKTRNARLLAAGSIVLANGLVGYFVFGSHMRTIFCDAFVVLTVFAFLKEMIPTYRNDAPLELCERGVIRRRQSYESRAGTLAFTPWEKITGVQWYDKLPMYYVHTKHLLLEKAVLSAEECEAVTNVAERFAPVYDTNGERIAGPTGEAGGAAAREQVGELRFQFSLQSVLLLMVVVSCAASCYGIHDRALRPQREALAKLQAFHPAVHYRFDEVWLIDFSASATKLRDGDLASLKGLESLEWLTIDGSPITDTGLRHLYSMTWLKYLSLRNTGVTKQGVEELRRRLPGVQVFGGP